MEKKSYKKPVSIVIIVLAILQQLSSTIGLCIFENSKGTLDAFLQDFCLSIPYYFIFFAGAPIILRFTGEKKSMSIGVAVCMSLLFAIIFYLLTMMVYQYIGYPFYFGIDLMITFILIGFVILIIEPTEVKQVDVNINLEKNNNNDVIINNQLTDEKNCNNKESQLYTIQDVIIKEALLIKEINLKIIPEDIDESFYNYVYRQYSYSKTMATLKANDIRKYFIVFTSHILGAGMYIAQREIFLNMNYQDFNEVSKKIIHQEIDNQDLYEKGFEYNNILLNSIAKQRIDELILKIADIVENNYDIKNENTCKNVLDTVFKIGYSFSKNKNS